MAYTASASTGPFPIDFPVFDGTGADLEVQLDGVVVAGWTFTGTLESGFYGEPNTWVNGSISFAAPVTGALVIYGLRAPRRQIAFQEGRGVPARDLNAELDMLTATAQEARRDIDEVRDGLTDLNTAVQAAQDAQEAAEDARDLAVEAYDNFDDRYLGDKTTLPTLDNDGNALVIGAMCFLKDQPDPNDDGPHRWNGTSWDNITVNPSAFERVVDLFVDATQAGTGVIDVTGGYTPGSGFEVKRNGTTQKQGSNLGDGEGDEDDDCTADDGTTVVFLAGRLNVGDWLQFRIRRPFLIASVAATDVSFSPSGSLVATDVQAAIEELDAEKAGLASPALTGTPTTPTAALGTNTTQIASTAFVKAALDALVDAAPGALDTLNELAAALGDDPNFAATMTTALAAKVPLASPALTGNPTAPTPTAGDNDTSIATTAFVTAAIAAALSATGAAIPGEVKEWGGPKLPALYAWADGAAVSRATYSLALANLTVTVTGTATSGSATISGVSEDLTGLGLEGAVVEGTIGSTSGMTIVSVTSSTIVLSGNSGANGAISLQIFPHGRGNGSTTFNLPDRKGRVGIGRDNMGGTAANRVTATGTGNPGIAATRLGVAGGVDRHQLIVAQIPSHAHQYSRDGTTGVTTGATTLFAGGETTPNTSSVGGDEAHPNVQPGIVMNYIVYLGQ